MTEDRDDRRPGRRGLLQGAGLLGLGSAALTGCTRSEAGTGPATVTTATDLITAVGRGQPEIRLGPGEYVLDAPLVLAPGTSLSGAGQTTRLKASGRFAADRPMIAIGNNTEHAGAVAVADLVVDCDLRAGTGIAIEGAGGNGYQGELDSMCRLDNLWVYDSRGDGIRYAGKASRSVISTRLRVRRARGHGFNIRNTDSWWLACEATTATATGRGAGFFVDGGANNFFEACKAWYCRDYGWRIRGVRNKFVGCESQDTRLHGWFIEWDRNVFTACVADTAGMWDVGGTAGSADGFYFAGGEATSIVGCQAFDRRPERARIQQRYGFNVPRRFRDSGCLVAPTGYDNAGGLVHLR